MAELSVVRSLLDELLQYTRQAFEKRDAVAARHIEPLEDVMDDMVNKLHDNHLIRLRLGLCSTQNGILFLDVLSNLERISDTCSNVGISVVARVNPDLASLAHNYVTSLHQGSDEQFNKDYQEAHNKYFSLLEETIPLDKKLDEIKEPDFNELTES
jgi:phosphate:Na+ symporter